MLPVGERFKAVIIAGPGGHECEIAQKIAHTYNLKHISTQQKIYENIKKRTILGNMAQTFKAAGAKISDEVLVKLISEEVENYSRVSWIVSGFPLNVNQARMFWDRHKLQMAISVAFPQEYVLTNLIHQYRNEQTEEAMTFTVSHVDKIMNKHRLVINPILKFYKDVGALKTYRERTLDGMWEIIRPSLKQEIMRKPPRQ